MGRIAVVHAQPQRCTHLDRVRRVADEPAIAPSRSSPSLASLLLSFETTTEELALSQRSSPYVVYARSVPQSPAVCCTRTGKLVTSGVCIPARRVCILAKRLCIRTIRNVIATARFVIDVHFRDMLDVESPHNRRPVYSIR